LARLSRDPLPKSIAIPPGCNLQWDNLCNLANCKLPLKTRAIDERAKPRHPIAMASPRPTARRVLIIDDEKNIRQTLTVCLEGFGCSATAVSTPEAALEALLRESFDVGFLDLRLGEVSGLDLIPRLLAASPNLAIVMITAYATFDSAVEAIKRGAVDYLP